MSAREKRPCIRWLLRGAILLIGAAMLLFQAPSAHATSFTYTSATTNATISIPANAKNLLVQVWGGGGGGGGASCLKSGSTIVSVSGAGGGGGAYSTTTWTAPSAGTLTYTVGAAGSFGESYAYPQTVTKGRSPSGTNGGASIASFSGATLTANGGMGGGGSHASSNGNLLGDGGAGGTANGGSTNTQGSSGGNAVQKLFTTATASGGGGGAGANSGSAGGQGGSSTNGSCASAAAGSPGKVVITYYKTTITSMSPNSGPAAGGTSVVINGTDFVNGGTTVKFGGVAATCTFNSVTKVTCQSPSHAAGAVTVELTTSYGTASTNYTYIAAPTITSLTPSFGTTAAGNTVTVTGSNFRASDTTVKFDGSVATCTVVSTTQLSCTVPAHAAGTVSVSASTSGGSFTKSSAYSYVAAPTVTGVLPFAGPVAGGTSVTVTGTNFVSGNTSIDFKGVAGTCSYVSSTQMSCTTPAQSFSGNLSVDVAATTPGGSGKKSLAFVYRDNPEISNISPASGDLSGGGTVTITGDRFYVTGENGDVRTVKFGDTEAVCTGNNTQLTCTAPSRATPGPVAISVATPGGIATKASAYTYNPSISLTLNKQSINLSGAFGDVRADTLNANVVTDNPHGYNLEISSSSPPLSCNVHPEEAIQPLTGTNAMLTDNRWGYAVDPTPASPSEPTIWNGVTTTPTVIATRGNATQGLGETTVVWLGTIITAEQPACTYSGTIILTAVALP